MCRQCANTGPKYKSNIKSARAHAHAPQVAPEALAPASREHPLTYESSVSPQASPVKYGGIPEEETMLKNKLQRDQVP